MVSNLVVCAENLKLLIMSPDVIGDLSAQAAAEATKESTDEAFRGSNQADEVQIVEDTSASKEGSIQSKS